MEDVTKKNKTGYWLDVIQWLFDCSRVVYDFSQEQSFPKRKDYQKSEEPFINSTASEHSISNSEARNSEPDKPADEAANQ